MFLGLAMYSEENVQATWVVQKYFGFILFLWLSLTEISDCG